MNYVKGTVFENGTGEPVSGATVYLYKDPKGKSGSIIDSTTTNEKGEYSINFSKKLRSRYYVSCKSNHHFPSPHVFDTEIEHGKNAVNFTLKPYSYLRLRYIKNTSSANAVGGSVRVPGTYGYYGTETWFFSPRAPGLYPDWIYATYDTVAPIPLKIFGNESHELEWRTRSMMGTYTEGPPNSFTFYAPKGDTVNYTITFD